MSKRMVDLNSVFFHGLEPKYVIKREKKALEKLECIFQCGAILSRSGQLSQLDLNTHEFMKKYFNNKFDPNWNGRDYISLCKKRSETMVNFDSNSFRTYVSGNDGISIALSRNIWDLIDLNRFMLLDGEFQVKDSIPLDDYMVGIVCGGKSFKELSDEVERGKKICLSQQEIKDYLQFNLDEKQDEIVDSVGNLLCKYGYDDIPIISSRDGFEVVRFQDAIEEMGCK